MASGKPRTHRGAGGTRLSPKTCSVPNCKNATRRGEKLCGEHLQYAALQLEIERISTLVSPQIRILQKDYDPGLEELLRALYKLSFFTDPRRGRALNPERTSPNAGQKDAWAGSSQLAELCKCKENDPHCHHIVTLNGAADTEKARRRQNYYTSELERLADRIEEELNPISAPRRSVASRLCPNVKCSYRGRRQPAFYQYCGYCGAAMEEEAA